MAHEKTPDNGTAPVFSEAEARAYFEKSRWPNGPVCPQGHPEPKLLRGKSTREGLYHCPTCRRQFTVSTGTIMENSHLPLAKWARAFQIMTSDKKGISAFQLQRDLGLGSYRTAWRIAKLIKGLTASSVDVMPRSPDRDRARNGAPTD